MNIKTITILIMMVAIGATGATAQEAEEWFKQSQTFAVQNKPRQGLDAIQKALEQDPQNPQYLEARAKLANWSGEYAIAADSYRQLAELQPDNKRIPLYLARADSWSGHLDRSVKGYKTYLKQHPKEKAVYLELAKVHTWRGNYPAAMKILDSYKTNFGQDKAYQTSKADILARAGRGEEGLALLEELLMNDPDNYLLNTAKTIALHYSRQPRPALRSLDKLRQMRPGATETEDLTAFIKTPTRSNIQVYGGYYSDSDDISILTGRLMARLYLSPNTALYAAGQLDHLEANANGPFANIDGSGDARHRAAWIGGAFRLSPAIALDGYIGSAKAEDLSPTTVYNITADINLGDTFNLKLGRRYGYFIISPRAVSLGILRGENTLYWRWDFSLRGTIVVHAAYDTFSDDNKRWEAIFFPRFKTSRTQRLNLDVGFRGWWFGFDKQLGNGYWAPDFFQSYMGALLGYWKLGPNSGVSFQAAAGILKDDTMDQFEFGYSIDTETFFGIYKDLLLKIRGSYLHNVRQPTGAFDAFLVSATLAIRF
jgi:tetratricopeptide (TPR) repeat protein